MALLGSGVLRTGGRLAAAAAAAAAMYGLTATEKLANQGRWDSSAAPILQPRVKSFMLAGHMPGGEGTALLTKHQPRPDLTHVSLLPSDSTLTYYRPYVTDVQNEKRRCREPAHSWRAAGARGGTETQISPPPRSFSHRIPCLAPRVPPKNAIAT